MPAGTWQTWRNVIHRQRKRLWELYGLCACTWICVELTQTPGVHLLKEIETPALSFHCKTHALERKHCRRPVSPYKEQSKSRSKFENWRARHICCREGTPQALSTREIGRALALAEELPNVRGCFQTEQWHKLQNKRCLLGRNELSVIGKLVLWGTRIIILLVYAKESCTLHTKAIQE